MTAEQVVSAFTLISGFVVVTNRNLFHAALALMASFLGVAGLYVLLEAGFLAAAQLLVYIGAISILVIFAIMLTRRLMQTDESPFNSQPVFGAITAILVFGVLGVVIARMNAFWPNARPDTGEGILRESVVTLGRDFVSPNVYVIPFEVASVLLLAALIGAILVAWPGEDEA